MKNNSVAKWIEDKGIYQRERNEDKRHHHIHRWRSWYPWALKVVGFVKYTVVSFGPRSAIERLFGDIECRIRRFWNGFVGKYTRESMERWVMSFSGFRNLMKNPKGVLS